MLTIYTNLLFYKIINAAEYISAQGIGDSAQGLANAILFVLFSRRVRNTLWRCVLCRRQVVDIVAETTSINQTADMSTNKTNVDSESVSEDLSHLLCESVDNNSLLIEFDKSSRII